MKENHLCFLLKWLDLRVCRQNLSNLKRLENSILAVIVLFVAYWTVWCLLKMVECSHVATAVSLTPQQIRGVQPQHWSCAGENTTLWKYVAVLMLGLGFRINHFIRATMNTLSKLGVALLQTIWQLSFKRFFHPSPVCRSQKSPWVCLKCGAVHCGRYTPILFTFMFEYGRNTSLVSTDGAAGFSPILWKNLHILWILQIFSKQEIHKTVFV